MTAKHTTAKLADSEIDTGEISPAMEPVPRLLLDAQQAARALSIGPSMLWMKTSDGSIPCVKIGRRTLYDPRDLRHWIDGEKKGAGDE